MHIISWGQYHNTWQYTKKYNFHIKENDSFNILQDHFYNKLQRSKMLLKYTDHLYDKQEHHTQALLHKNEPLRWYWNFQAMIYALNSIVIHIISWGKYWDILRWLYRYSSIR